MRKRVSGHLQGGGVMRMLRTTCPANYQMCNQTVTVYHWDGGANYTRKVIDNAFLDLKKTQNVDKTGRKDANGFLLVVPGSVAAVSVGDKVFVGVGPEIATREAWAAFVPSKVNGLVVVKTVDTKHWNGVVAHTEAGG